MYNSICPNAIVCGAFAITCTEKFYTKVCGGSVALKQGSIAIELLNELLPSPKNGNCGYCGKENLEVYAATEQMSGCKICYFNMVLPRNPMPEKRIASD